MLRGINWSSSGASTPRSVPIPMPRTSPVRRFTGARRTTVFCLSCDAASTGSVAVKYVVPPISTRSRAASTLTEASLSIVMTGAKDMSVAPMLRSCTRIMSHRGGRRRGSSEPQLTCATAGRGVLPVRSSATGGASPSKTQRTFRIVFRSGEVGAAAIMTSIQPLRSSSIASKGNRTGTLRPCSATMSTVLRVLPSIRRSRIRWPGLACHPSQRPRTTVYF